MQPKIQATVAGASDAVMLDVEGFVLGTNAAHIFLVKEDGLMTPLAGSCLPGITRFVFSISQVTKTTPLHNVSVETFMWRRFIL